MGLIFAAVAIAIGLWSRTVPRAARLDFDVAGFLFLLMNLPIVFLWFIALIFAALAIYCWLNAAGLRG
jgi:hypothetical protein